MKISIISVFPEIHQMLTATSIIGRAVEQGLISFHYIRFSDMCEPKERIDEPVCGPGVGMILKPVVVEKAIKQAEQRWGQGFKVFFSPHGTVLTQPILKQYAAQFFTQSGSAASIHPSSSFQDSSDTQHERVVPQLEPVLNLSNQIKTNSAHPECFAQQNISKGVSGNHLILICGRYEGIDARVEQHYADAIFSIGDYVLMGGDLPAQVFLEGLLRLLPGVVGKQESVEQESFESSFLDHPHYGLPVEWNDVKIPDVLRSGNHAAIASWRKNAAVQRTIKNRFDWFVSSQPSHEAIADARAFIPPHYLAVMHTQVLVKDDKLGYRVGQTSIPSLDIHDVARSCTSYGIKNFFIVSPLIDQQEIVGTFMEFWLSPEGNQYNPNRHQAISSIKQAYSYDEMIQIITKQEGKEPLIIATSARTVNHQQQIDYFSQKIVWQHQRPILFLFGTGQGLSDELLEKSDYILCPVNGLTDYNHLSVRSAVAIILDRWLGLHPHLGLNANSPKVG